MVDFIEDMVTVLCLIINWIMKVIFSTSNLENYMDVAAIHATILSILIGSISAYIVYIHSTIDQMENRIFQEVDKINGMDFGGSYRLPIEEQYDTSKTENREKLIKQFIKLSMGVPVRELDTVNRGMEILKIISALSSYYPFPQKQFRSLDGTFSIKNQSQIRFNNIKDVINWVNALEEVASDVLWIKNAHSEKFWHYVKEVDRIEGINVSFIAEMFLQNVSKSKEIVNNIHSQLTQITVYKSRLPRKSTILNGAIFAAITFLCGIVFPMFFSSLSNFILIWIPLFFYSVVFMLMTKYFLKNYIKDYF